MSKYWNKRYQNGETSGAGSVGEFKEWKWQQIIDFCPTFLKKTVLDAGCGDMSFWQDKPFPKEYLGIDFSEHIIEQNKKMYDLEELSFHHGHLTDPFPKQMDLSFCFDVIFHILRTDDIEKIIRNLCLNTKEMIFIYTWDRNPWKNWRNQLSLLKSGKIKTLLANRTKEYDDYQRFHRMEDFIPIFSEYDFNTHTIISHKSCNAMYVFFKEGFD